MQSENRLFDDFVKVLNGAAGTFAGMGHVLPSIVWEKLRALSEGARLASE